MVWWIDRTREPSSRLPVGWPVPRLLAEATSLGAAVAGGVGVGLYAGYEEVGRLVRVEPGEMPRSRVSGRYQELYEIFQRTYASLAPVYEQLAGA